MGRVRVARVTLREARAAPRGRARRCAPMPTGTRSLRGRCGPRRSRPAGHPPDARYRTTASITAPTVGSVTPGRPRAPAGPRNVLVLDQPHRLPEDGAAHLVALQQLGLRPQHLADRPTQHHDVLDDAVGHLGGPLRVESAPGRGTSRVAVGVIRRSLAAHLPFFRPMTCTFRKRVCRKGWTLARLWLHENMVFENGASWPRG